MVIVLWLSTSVYGASDIALTPGKKPPIGYLLS